MLTIAHADRGRPTLNDDERFRNGYFHDFKIRTLMCTRSILCKNSRLNVLLYIVLKIVAQITQMLCDRSTKNVCDEVNFELLDVAGKHEIDEVHFQLLTGKHEIPEGEEFKI